MSERMTREALTAALIRDGVIAADAPPPPAESDDRPWFISALQGTAGWLATERFAWSVARDMAGGLSQTPAEGYLW